MSIPKVLLLGNGINRAFNSDSWEEMIKAFSDNDKKVEVNRDIPMTLQPIILSNNNVHETLKKVGKDNKLYGVVKNSEMMSLLQSVLELGFDDIITTNYSYELECAAFGVSRISDYQLRKIRRTYAERAEGKYLIRTYNEVVYKGHKNRIWHIHGAAKNPGSIVIGHYYYGNLLTHYKNYFDSVGNSYQTAEDEGKEYLTKSWLDSFVLGDIYSVGFGFDFSEFDLWWLLDRKKREKASHGILHHYAPYWEDEKNKSKYELMKCYDISIHNKNPKVKDGNYVDYYKSLIGQMNKEVGT